jgi:hypothetical protein
MIIVPIVEGSAVTPLFSPLVDPSMPHAHHLKEHKFGKVTNCQLATRGVQSIILDVI